MCMCLAADKIKRITENSEITVFNYKVSDRYEHSYSIFQQINHLIILHWQQQVENVLAVVSVLVASNQIVESAQNV